MPRHISTRQARRLGEQLERDQVGDDGQRPADRPRALDHAERLAARLRPHQLGDEHRADAPLGAEADALEDAEDHQHLVARGEAREEREDRVDGDASSISVRARPIRSASTPPRMPPTAEADSVTVDSAPVAPVPTPKVAPIASARA